MPLGTIIAAKLAPERRIVPPISPQGKSPGKACGVACSELAKGGRDACKKGLGISIRIHMVHMDGDGMIEILCTKTIQEWWQIRRLLAFLLVDSCSCES